MQQIDDVRAVDVDRQRDVPRAGVADRVREQFAPDGEEHLGVGGRRRGGGRHGHDRMRAVGQRQPGGDRVERGAEAGRLELVRVQVEDLGAQLGDRPGEPVLGPVEVLDVAAARALDVLLRAQQVLHELVVEDVGELAPGARLGPEGLGHERPPALGQLADPRRAPREEHRQDDGQRAAPREVEGVDDDVARGRLVPEGRADDRGEREAGEREQDQLQT